MIILQPSDGKGKIYYVVNMVGEVVHAYRDLDAAKQSLEGAQRIFTFVEATREWPDGPPCVHPDWLPKKL